MISNKVVRIRIIYIVSDGLIDDFFCRLQGGACQQFSYVLLNAEGDVGGMS